MKQNECMGEYLIKRMNRLLKRGKLSKEMDVSMNDYNVNKLTR